MPITKQDKQQLDQLMAVVMILDYLRREAEAGRPEDFEKYLAAVPNVAASETDRTE